MKGSLVSLGFQEVSYKLATKGHNDSFESLGYQEVNYMDTSKLSTSHTAPFRVVLLGFKYLSIYRIILYLKVQ